MEHWVKYISVARIHDNTIVATYSHDMQSKSQVYYIQADNELRRILADLAFTDWRQKFASSYGSWYMITDEYQIAYLALVKSDYPERHVWNLLEDVKNLMYQQGADTMKSCPSDTYTRILTTDFKVLAVKYDDLNKLDKLYRVNQEVIEVQGIVQDNIHQAMKNIDNAEKINYKAEEMEQTAGWFSKKAGNLKRAMCYRNFRITIVLVLVLLVIIAIIIAVVASAANN